MKKNYNNIIKINSKTKIINKVYKNIKKIIFIMKIIINSITCMIYLTNIYNKIKMLIKIVKIKLLIRNEIIILNK